MNRSGLRTVVFICLILVTGTIPALAQFGGGTLDGFVPAVGPNGSTPTIIRQQGELFVAGYTDSILVLYRNETGAVVATAQMRELSGELYNAEQNAKLNGPSKTFRSLAQVELDYPVIQYSRINNFEQSALFVNYFHIIEDEAGNRHLDTHWGNTTTFEPEPGQRVFHVIANSFVSGNEQALTNLIFDQFSIDTYENEPNMPDAYISESHTFNNKVNLVIVNNTDEVLDYSLTTTLATENSVISEPVQDSLTLQPGNNDFEKDLGPFLTVDVILYDDNNKKQDKVRTFDGGWVNENEGIEQESVFFSTRTCHPILQDQATEELNIEGFDNLLFSGCAIQRTTAENEDGTSTATLKRMIVSANGVKSLTNYNSIIAKVKSTGNFKVCFDRFLSDDQPCVEVTAMPMGDWLTINLDDFLVDQDNPHSFTLNDVQSISFIENTAGTHTLEISNLMVSDAFRLSSTSVKTLPKAQQPAGSTDTPSNKPTNQVSSEKSGCASSQANSWLLTLILSVWFIGWVIRRDHA